MFYVDLETTCNGGPNGDSPEAHWLNNKVILCGWKKDYLTVNIGTDVNALCDAIKERIAEKKQAWLCAHNAKFDIKYLMRDRPDVPWQHVRLWCTMTYEYLSSGHEWKFMSLEDSLASRGIPFKKSLDLGAILASGLKMEDIPITELTTYLRQDVLVLRNLYKSQRDENYQPDMDYIMPLCEMELNGLPINRSKATVLATKLHDQVELATTYYRGIIINSCEWQDGTPVTPEDFCESMGTKSKTIKPMANRTLSFLLFGEPEQLNITPKWKLKYRPGYSPIYVGMQAESVYGPNVKPGAQGYPMSEDDILKIESVLGTKQLLTHMLYYRKANKLLGTYVGPFLATSAIQGNIYPKLNTTATGTGRLSSSDPNGQNIPPEARELVEADKGNDIVEVDFSQLEMVGAAVESGDPDMIKDLQDGEDLHFNTGRSVMGWKTPADMTKPERTLVKNVNFGVLYGGKAPGLAVQTGVDQALIKKLIKAFYDRYPRVRTWQEEVYEQVVTNMKTYDIKEGEQRYASMYTLPLSGRRFHFVENESPPWLRAKTGRKFSFSPQQTANYPIQGFAGGDIVMSALYFLWSAVHETGANDYIKFRMTVHDSIVLEVKKGINIDHIVKMMCEHVVKKYKLPVDLNVDVETHSYWH